MKLVLALALSDHFFGSFRSIVGLSVLHPPPQKPPYLIKPTKSHRKFCFAILCLRLPQLNSALFRGMKLVLTQAFLGVLFFFVELGEPFHSAPAPQKPPYLTKPAKFHRKFFFAVLLYPPRPQLNNALFRGMKLVLTLALLGHFFGCFWSFVSLFEESSVDTDSDSPSRWWESLGLQEDDLPRRYIASIYWAFTTMTTVG